MKELEKRGVATVALVSDDFIDDHCRTADSMGISGLPYARLAAPLVSQTPQQVRDLVDESVDAVLAGLTQIPEAGHQVSGVTLRTEPAHQEAFVALPDWSGPDSAVHWQLAIESLQAWAQEQEQEHEDERLALTPEDLGLRLTYLWTGPVTDPVPDCDLAVPFAAER